MKLYLNDDSMLIEKMFYLIDIEPDNEHCAVATAVEKICGDIKRYNITEYCMAEDLGGRGMRFQFSLPPKVCYALLNICKRNGGIPVIVHTHPPCGEDEKVYFSDQDIKFKDKFATVAKSYGISSCWFIVMDCKNVIHCILDLNTMKSKFFEGWGVYVSDSSRGFFGDI